ncbi:MAG: hypothetical protein II554_06185, partial [Bacteroidales bacterium]|nr:hypothetical protein [Bacteroidales bacterium]
IQLWKQLVMSLGRDCLLETRIVYNYIEKHVAPIVFICNFAIVKIEMNRIGAILEKRSLVFLNIKERDSF